MLARQWGRSEAPGMHQPPPSVLAGSAWRRPLFPPPPPAATGSRLLAGVGAEERFCAGCPLLQLTAMAWGCPQQAVGGGQAFSCI